MVVTGKPRSVRAEDTAPDTPSSTFTCRTDRPALGKDCAAPQRPRTRRQLARAEPHLCSPKSWARAPEAPEKNEPHSEPSWAWLLARSSCAQGAGCPARVPVTL